MPATPTPPAPAKAKSPFSTLFLAIAITLLVFMMFDQNLRDWTGHKLSLVLNPVIGFGYGSPLATLILAGIMMVVISTVIRHFFVDWITTAKNQETMRTFQKEFSEARKSNNMYKIKRLTELQGELMKTQSEQMGSQMKPMFITMLVVIPIFTWLSFFMTEAEATNPEGMFIDMPWLPDGSHGYPLTGSYILPHWILIYSLISIPIGIVLQRALKLFEFRKTARAEGLI